MKQTPREVWEDAYDAASSLCELVCEVGSENEGVPTLDIDTANELADRANSTYHAFVALRDVIRREENES